MSRCPTEQIQRHMSVLGTFKAFAMHHSFLYLKALVQEVGTLYWILAKYKLSCLPTLTLKLALLPHHHLSARDHTIPSYRRHLQINNLAQLAEVEQDLMFWRGTVRDTRSPPPPNSSRGSNILILLSEKTLVGRS